MRKVDILLVDDDKIITTTAELCLKKENYCIHTVHSGSKAIQQAKKLIPKLILLDVIMPDMDGYQVCREIRADKKLASVPIIFLTAKTGEEDQIFGFKAGGDDYITKPFNPEILRLHVKAVLKRTQDENKTNRRNQAGTLPREERIFAHAKVTQPVIEIKGYKLNILTFELVLPNNMKMLLTPIQFDLLFNFMSHPGDIFSPSSLLCIIWDFPPDTGSTDLVRVHIKNLRNRIEADPLNPTFVETVPGYGYTVRPD